jgi:immune inhibitor A
MKYSIFTIIFYFLSVNIFAQMPPHPDLLEKIKRGEVDKSILSNFNELRAKGIDAPWSSAELNKSANGAWGRIFGPAKKVSGVTKALVILVSFSDNIGKAAPTNVDKLLFSTGPGTLNNFYKENSYGQIDLVTLNLPSEIGWQTAPHPYSYYVGTGSGEGDYPNNSQGLVEDIVKQVDSLVDFSKYDNDGDGYVDALFIIHAGPGAEVTGNKTKDIWSHAWSTRQPIALDGVYVSRYSIEPEYVKGLGDMSIGVFAHELGHALFGLPDLYDTDYTSEGVGNWSLMAAGSWNGPGSNGASPSYFDAWCKMQVGVLEPTLLVNDTLNLNILQSEKNPTAYRIWKNGIVGNEFYLLENREKTGSDAYLPGSGLIIYHVDNNAYSNTNEWIPGAANKGHYRVALVQADGAYDLERNTNRGDAGDPFPGSSNNTLFTSTSSPTSLDYNYNYTNIALQNISHTDTVITLDANLHDDLNTTSSQISFLPHELVQSADTASIVLKNTGTNSVIINKITSNNVFKLLLPSTPTTIAKNDSLKIKIVFNPVNVGSYSDTILIQKANSIFSDKLISVIGKAFVLNTAVTRSLYASTGSSNNGNTAIINKVTGTAKNIGKAGYDEIKSISVNPKTKVIYGLTASTSGSAILKINSALGDAYKFNDFSISNLASIAFDTSGVLYAISKSGIIYTLNLDNGAIKEISSTNIVVSSMAINPVDNQMWVSSYLPIGYKDRIFRINTLSGASTLIGRTGFNIINNAIIFDENGNLFGVKGAVNSANDFISINTNTGVGAIIGSTGLNNITGLAYLPGTITSVNENVNKSIPKTFSLLQNYPNPFNPSTTIKYAIPQNGNVQIIIYNALGEAVKVIDEGYKLSGGYQTLWNSDNQSGKKVGSGVYFYKLNFSSNNGALHSETKKMILIK